MQSFTMHSITLRQIRELEPGLFFGIDQNGGARLWEPGKFRGYVLDESSRGRPCYRVDCWNAGHTVTFRRRYKTKAGAERGLAFHGLRLAKLAAPTPTAA